MKTTLQTNVFGNEGRFITPRIHRSRLVFGLACCLTSIGIAATSVAQPPPPPPAAAPKPRTMAPVPPAAPSTRPATPGTMAPPPAPRPSTTMPTAPKAPAATAPAAPMAPATSKAPNSPAATAPRPPVAGAAKPAAGSAADAFKMETLELVTKDNVNIRAFYFPSDKGKDAVPVILCHEWQGQASPYGGLVRSLVNAGCAVIVPEFRGHGESRDYEVAGRKKEFDLSRMNRGDIASIIAGDMEAVKKHLRAENDAEKLNLNALALIGIKEGAIIASHWAIADLNFPSVGSRKQGQDVKAMVLVSPEKLLKGFSLDETLTDRLFWQLPFLIMVGQGSPQFADADRFQKRLETMKKKAGRGEASGLVFDALPTSLAGPALVNEASVVSDRITMFLKRELIDNASKIPWVKRD